MEMGARRKMSALSTSGLSVNYCYQLSTLNKVALLFLGFALLFHHSWHWITQGEVEPTKNAFSDVFDVINVLSQK